MQHAPAICCVHRSDDNCKFCERQSGALTREAQQCPSKLGLKLGDAGFASSCDDINCASKSELSCRLQAAVIEYLTNRHTGPATQSGSLLLNWKDCMSPALTHSSPSCNRMAVGTKNAVASGLRYNVSGQLLAQVWTASGRLQGVVSPDRMPDSISRQTTPDQKFNGLDATRSQGLCHCPCVVCACSSLN